MAKQKRSKRASKIKLEALETCGWVIKPCLGCRYDILKAFHLEHKLSHYIIICITAFTSLFCKEAFIGPRGGRNSKPCVFTKQSFINFFPCVNETGIVEDLFSVISSTNHSILSGLSDRGDHGKR